MIASAIAPWFHLLLPCWGRGFNSHAHHQCFFLFELLKLYLYWNEKRTKIYEKDAGICPNLKNIFEMS